MSKVSPTIAFEDQEDGNLISIVRNIFSKVTGN